MHEKVLIVYLTFFYFGWNNNIFWIAGSYVTKVNKSFDSKSMIKRNWYKMFFCARNKEGQPVYIHINKKKYRYNVQFVIVNNEL